MLTRPKHIILFILSAVTCLHCNLKLSKSENFGESVAPCNQDTLLTFDFRKEPLQSDIKLIATGALDSCIVTNESVLGTIMKERSYDKLYYNNRIETGNPYVFTLLGSYDDYHDLLLVSIDDNKLADWAIIASLGGDAEHIVEITSKFTKGNQLDIVQINGKQVSSKPDSIYVSRRVNLRLRIDEFGLFNRTVLSTYEADSIK